jgi:hypothetical protein
MSNPNPFGRHGGLNIARARAKLRPAPERVLRPSLRQATLEAHRLATDADMMGEAPVDSMRPRPELGAVDLHVTGEEKPIRVFGFTDELEGA